MKKLTQLALAPALVLSMNAMANPLEKVSLESETTVRISETSTDVLSKLAVSAKLTKEIKAVIKAEIAKGDQFDNFFDDEKYKDVIEEAYIVYHGGSTFSAIFGKKEIRLGAESNLKDYRSSKAYSLKSERYPVAITVQLKLEQLKGLQVSVFETGNGNTATTSDRTGEWDGFAVSAGKDLNKDTSVYGSYMTKGNEENANAEESQAVVGVIYRTNGWELGAEGIWMDENPDFSNKEFAYILSAAKQIGMGTLAAEYTSVHDKDSNVDAESELAVEYQIQANESIMFAPGVRYSKDSAGNDDTKWMLNMIFKFQKDAKRGTLLK